MFAPAFGTDAHLIMGRTERFSTIFTTSWFFLPDFYSAVYTLIGREEISIIVIFIFFVK
jgi:hypothetical protein